MSRDREARSITAGAAALAAALLVLAGASAAAVAQQDTPPPPHAAMGHGEGGPDCTAMMQRHQQMQQRLQEMDAELDRLVARMKTATGDDKVDATAAVVEELVAQRQQMRGMMMENGSRMSGHMMQHMEHGGMAGMKDCPMMKDMGHPPGAMHHGAAKPGDGSPGTATADDSEDGEETAPPPGAGRS